MKACALLELLCVLALALMLLALSLLVIARGTRTAKAWIYGSYHYQENRISAFLIDEDTFPQHFWATNTVRPWFK